MSVFECLIGLTFDIWRTWQDTQQSSPTKSVPYFHNASKTELQSVVWNHYTQYFYCICYCICICRLTEECLKIMFCIMLGNASLCSSAPCWYCVSCKWCHERPGGMSSSHGSSSVCCSWSWGEPKKAWSQGELVTYILWPSSFSVLLSHVALMSLTMNVAQHY